MSLDKIFYMLKDAELRAAELYAQLGLNLSIVQPALSDLFNELSEDEKLHARQIELVRDLILQCRDAYLEKPEAEELIREFLQNVEAIKSYFNQHNARLQPSDLINLALDLERSLVEKHGIYFASTRDAGVKSLFQSLNLGDTAHIRKLEDFQPG